MKFRDGETEGGLEAGDAERRPLELHFFFVTCMCEEIGIPSLSPRPAITAPAAMGRV